MNGIVKYVYILLGLAIVGYYGYSSYYGRAIFESKVERNTEYSGKRGIRSGYGNRFNHK